MSFSFPRLAVAAGLVTALTVSAVAQDKRSDAPVAPKNVQVGPPPELAALRAAVEEAAKKGENVDEIRAKLQDLEKAMTGRTWARPKVAPEPPDQPNDLPRRNPPANPGGNNPFGGLMLPQGGNNPFGGLGGLGGLGAFNGLGGGGQADLDDLIKAQGLLLRAAQLAAQDPPDEKAVEALRKEANEMLAKALGGRGLALPGGLDAFGDLGGLGGLDGFDLPAAPMAKPRLGVTVEPANVELDREEGVPAGRGVRVVEVSPGLPAAKAGLKKGDVIVEFAGRAVASNSQTFVRIVQQAKAGQKVDIVFVRDGKRQTAKAVALENPAD